MKEKVSAKDRDREKGGWMDILMRAREEERIRDTGGQDIERNRKKRENE